MIVILLTFIFLRHMVRKRNNIEFKGENSNEMEFKSILCELKAKDVNEDGSLHIKAYALAFNNVDSYGDIISPTACDAMLSSDDVDRIAFCNQHDIRTVIGIITSKTVDDYGLLFEADILPTTIGKDVILLIKAGALKEFSIGYQAKRYHYERRDGYDYEIRVLDEIKIYEISPVTIAANPKAVLLDAKGENINKDNTQNSETMDIKELQESLSKEQAARIQLETDIKAYKDKLDEANKKADEQEQKFINLDKSQKELKENLDALQEKMQEKAKMDIKSFLDAHKDEIEKKLSVDGGRIRLEMKDITTASVNPNLSISIQSDTEISSARRKPNTFINLLGLAQRTADKLAWIEGSVTENVGYVDENALNSNKGDVNVGEVQRQYGKLQTSLYISTETNDWYSMVVDWAQNEANKALMSKLNEEIWKGEGADTSAATKKKIYGIKGASTAFAAIAKVKKANYADVIFNAVEQIINAGYTANVALVSPAVYFVLASLKNDSGSYILDRQTDLLCSKNGEVRIIKAPELTGNEIEVMDTNCAKPYAGNSFEFEAVRDADYDRYKFFFRIAAQNKIKTDWKKGLVYVSDATTAVTALTEV